MILFEICMKNYKSLGDNDHNKLYCEPDVTTIIGRNESGKTNVLRGISEVSFFGNMSNAFGSDNVNRSEHEKQIEYEIVLRNSEKEKELDISDTTYITIDKDNLIAKGGILEYFLREVKQYSDLMVDILSKNPSNLGGNDLEALRKYLNYLRKEDALYLKKINDSLPFFKSRINVSEENKKIEIKDSITAFENQWTKLCDLLPQFFFRLNDRVLYPTYSYEELSKELASPESYPNSLLPSLLKIIGIEKNDLLLAVQSGSSGVQVSLRSKIDRFINEKINVNFKKFYETEAVCLHAKIDSRILYFTVQTDEGEELKLDERSNGLKWYLNLYIDILANELNDTNVVYLFDEPGISLHVNAQNELLNLFKDLAGKGNQVIYSTHLPSMLNLNQGGIQKIRSITKDRFGITSIYNKAWDANILQEHQLDTLAPIVNAIGMSINNEFGPNQNRLNIVCEGPSDYIYLKNIFSYLHPSDNHLNIIPSQGVSNIQHICNILAGWDCCFVALFDYDKPGINYGYKVFKNNELYKYDIDYLFIKDVPELDIDSFTQDNCYMMEDLVGRSLLGKCIEENNLPKDSDKNEKVLLAKIFTSKVSLEKLSRDSQCFTEFEKLYNRLDKLYQEFISHQDH
jgi:predicted ATPase